MSSRCQPCGSQREIAADDATVALPLLDAITNWAFVTESILDVRELLSHDLKDVPEDSVLREGLHAMQTACRMFWDENQSPRSGYGPPYEAQLHSTLGGLRALFGVHIARIACAHDWEWILVWKASALLDPLLSTTRIPKHCIRFQYLLAGGTPVSLHLNPTPPFPMRLVRALPPTLPQPLQARHSRLTFLLEGEGGFPSDGWTAAIKPKSQVGLHPIEDRTRKE
jgi:hypothetical protein